jgi:hypothetical protein
MTSATTKPNPSPSRHATAADTTVAVDAFMAALVHPFKAEIQALRQSILEAAPGIAEGIKWKAPSFRTHEYFATVNLREKHGVSIILHLGAKVRDVSPVSAVEDPAQLLTWLASDRAVVRFTHQADFQSKKTAFESLIRIWFAHV